MILIIGYGNPFRSDDGIGQQIAMVMEQRLKGEEVQVMTAYQLTPELVEPMCHAELVIFIDARMGQMPGTIMQETVELKKDAGVFTHHISPAALLSATQELYGMSPKGLLISIVGAVFDYGNELSPQLQQMLPDIAGQVEAIIKTTIPAPIYGEINHA